tara:strand:+ start:911 stop:1774 length:864 start_codon:yes stop_codon:yes gene_type:complete
MTTSKYIVLNETNFVSIKGKDIKDFLQGIITNDINKCHKKVIYSCLLTPQGKFLSDFFVIPIEDYYIVEINKAFFKTFISKLKIYKLRSNVEIQEIQNLISVIILNTPIDKSLELGSMQLNNDYIEYVDPRNLNLGKKIIIKNDLIDKYIISNNYERMNPNDYEKIMIENLIPNSTKDLKVEKSLLLENNFENINAIDWNKGCYIGQELTARMKYRALLKKSLRLIKIDSGKVDSEDEVLFENNNIGKITSIVENYGLALLKIQESEKSINDSLILNTKNGKIKIIN